MSLPKRPVLIACCLLAGCGGSSLGDAPDAQAPLPAPTCADSQIILDWGTDEDVEPPVTVPGDGFYGLANDPPHGRYNVQRYDSPGEPSVVATLPIVPGTWPILFARDGTLDYARATDAEIRHGAVGGPETVVTTGGRRVVAVEAADRGGLFVAYRDIARDQYFYTIYDGAEERVTDSFTSDASVHPRSGGRPVLARLGEDGRLLAGVAGEPMTELPSACAARRPYAVLALTDGRIAWAHACSSESADLGSIVGVRAPTGEVTWRKLTTPARSVSLAEGPGGTILAAFLVGYRGELSLELLDARLDVRAHAALSVIHRVPYMSRVYEFPLSSLALSRTTIGPVFTMHGRFRIPDGYIEKLGFGTLCSER